MDWSNRIKDLASLSQRIAHWLLILVLFAAWLNQRETQEAGQANA